MNFVFLFEKISEKFPLFSFTLKTIEINLIKPCYFPTGSERQADIIETKLETAIS